MKLSEISTDKGLEVLCEITPYVANISADEELLQILKDTAGVAEAKNRAEMLMIGAEKMAKLVPILLQTHKADVYGILSVVNGTTIAEIEKQNFLQTVKQIKDIISDKELLSFFK